MNHLGHIDENTDKVGELFMEEVIPAAIDINMQIEAVLFPDGQFLDVGTPDNLFRAVCHNPLEKI